MKVLLFELLECDMGLITGLPTLPMARVCGLGWEAEKPNIPAEGELRDPGVLRAQPAAPNQDLGDRDISLEKFEREEERLTERLHTARGCFSAERSKVTSWITRKRWLWQLL
ncbi:gas vesicle protein GvpG [Streptomyces sp. NPDC001940]